MNQIAILKCRSFEEKKNIVCYKSQKNLSSKRYFINTSLEFPFKLKSTALYVEQIPKHTPKNINNYLDSAHTKINPK